MSGDEEENIYQFMFEEWTIRHIGGQELIAEWCPHDGVQSLRNRGERRLFSFLSFVGFGVIIDL